MLIEDLMTGGKITPCIVVDIQPAHSDSATFLRELMAFLNEHDKILCIYDIMHGDDLHDVMEYWEEFGFDSAKWKDVEFIYKAFDDIYRWTRSGVDIITILKTLRLMYAQKVTSSSDLFGGTDAPGYIDKMRELGEFHENFNFKSNPLSMLIYDDDLDTLKKYSGGYLMGGERHQCLREVQLCMNAINIKYKTLNRFVYGP